jgi:hypothetical protein
MNFRFLPSALCGSLLALLMLHASAQDRFADPQIREIQRRHDLAALGDKQQTNLLATDLETLVKTHPEDKLLLAYLGSVYTLKSRDAFPGPGKLHYLKEGLKTLDTAVEAEPEAIPPRFIRAVNNYSLPGFCMRRDTARSDFKKLLGQIEQPGMEKKLNAETRQAIYYFAGLSYKQTREPDQARDAWERGWNLAPTSALAILIKTQLSKLKK